MNSVIAPLKQKEEQVSEEVDMPDTQIRIATTVMWSSVLAAEPLAYPSVELLT